MGFKFICDRCGAEGREVGLYERYPARSYDLCESCADDFKMFMEGEE